MADEVRALAAPKILHAITPWLRGPAFSTRLFLVAFGAVILSEDKTIHSADVLIGGGAPMPQADQPLSMSEMEKQFIKQSLELNTGNVTDTARALGLTRTALYRRMKRHGL